MPIKHMKSGNKAGWENHFLGLVLIGVSVLFFFECNDYCDTVGVSFFDR